MMHAHLSRVSGSVLAVFAVGSVGVAPVWAQVTGESLKLVADDLALARQLGQSIVVDNGVIAVGCLLGFNTADVEGTQSGSVYLYDAATGVQINRLFASDGTSADHFGFSIDMDNGVVAIGARGDDDRGLQSGAVYLFDVSTGNQLFKLLPIDGAAGDEFGYSVAIDNGIVAVGARLDDDEGVSSGSAYLFDASTGNQLMKLLPSTGSSNDEFGTAIAMDNGVVAVGSPGDDTVITGDGAAFLFNASTGAQIAKLLTDDAGLGDRLGNSIAIDGDIVAVGAQWDDEFGINSGSAYLFNASTGEQLLKLLPTGGQEDDEFGSSIALSAGIVVVGENLDPGASLTSCSAYLFDAATGAQMTELAASDGTMGDGFGFSVAIDNGLVAVTANHDDFDTLFPDRGSAYVFAVDCAADFTGEGDLDIFDVLAFLDAFNAMDPAADFTEDGNFNIFDVLAFLDAFNAGCP